MPLLSAEASEPATIRDSHDQVPLPGILVESRPRRPRKRKTVAAPSPCILMSARYLPPPIIVPSAHWQIPEPALPLWSKLALGSGLVLVLTLGLVLSFQMEFPSEPLSSAPAVVPITPPTKGVAVATVPVIPDNPAEESKPAAPVEESKPAAPLPPDPVVAELPKESQGEAPAPKPAPPSVVVMPAAPPTNNFGTSVNFVATPRLAFRQAFQEDKLVFLLHVSGNFEESAFT